MEPLHASVVCDDIHRMLKEKEQTDQNRDFMQSPVREILKELGLPPNMEFNSRDSILLDGFDELCMMDGMTKFAEHLLSEIIRGLSSSHIVITTRPKFIDVAELKQKGIGTGIAYILLNHFDAEKREEWIQNYRQICGKEDYPKLERIRIMHGITHGFVSSDFW